MTRGQGVQIHKGLVHYGNPCDLEQEVALAVGPLPLWNYYSAEDSTLAVQRMNANRIGPRISRLLARLLGKESKV